MTAASRARWLTGALLLAVVGFGVRALDAPRVFPDDGTILLGPHDPSYHARRALYTFERFPDLLLVDPYLAHPDGAVVPMPPLFDWMLGAAARAVGTTTRDFEWTAAWVSPLLGALAVLATVWAAHGWSAGPALALGAGALLALLPAHAEHTRVGYPDHDGLVSLIAALWLGAQLRVLRGSRSRPRWGAALLLTLCTTAMALTWSGSLLYLAVASAALLLAALASGRPGSPRLLLAQAGSALVAAGLLVPWLWHAPTPIGGPLSSTTLSWLHAVFLVALATLAAGLAALEVARPAGVLQRLVRAGVLGISIAALIRWALPLDAALSPGLGFLEASEAFAIGNIEQRGLFAAGAGASATALLGAFAWLLPVAWLGLVPALRDPTSRPGALLVLIWYAAFAALAWVQVRFAGDLAVPAVIVFAVGLGELARIARGFLPARAAALPAGAIALVLLAPSLAHLGLKLPRFVAPLRGQPAAPRPPSAEATLVAFMEAVRAATPETAGFLAPGRPEYGVLVAPNFGHVTAYRARRATPAGNMGPYLDADKFERSYAFLAAPSEADAWEIAEALRARYVVTAAFARMHAGRFDHQLHVLDGNRSATQPALARFRLITESPAGGTPLHVMFPGRFPSSVVAYKLFERVPGALLEARAAPGAWLHARIVLHTPKGRRFSYRARARADAAGLASLRVPYATDGRTAVRSEGAYVVLVDGQEHRVEVQERDVAEGRAVVVDAPSSARS